MKNKKMSIVHISDTHNYHRELQNDLPAADMIIHSGDVSMYGEPKEVDDFAKWFIGLDYKYKIFIAGNHDYCLYDQKAKAIQSHLPANCYYLYNSGVKINGINFWGEPFFMEDEIDNRFLKTKKRIPVDTDILISHRPPYGILDTSFKSFGCPDLLLAVLRIAPRYHLFGHVHDAYGIDKAQATTFINAALTNEKYELVNKPILIKA